MRVVLALAFMAIAQITAAAEVRRTHSIEALPPMFLSYAYAVGEDSLFLDRLSSGGVPEGIEDFESPLVQKYQKLHAVLQASEAGKRLERELVGLGHYCWLKWQPGMDCGDPAQRHFTDNGYLYITDPVWSDEVQEEPFLIVIASGVSPRTTSIYRLYEDRVELLYGRGDDVSERCGLGPYDALFVTFGVQVVDDGVLLLTETEGFHWDMLPRREYRLEVAGGVCQLVKVIEESWLESVEIE